MAKKQPAPEEKAILRAMDEKSKKSLRLNFILQGFTLLTAIASLVSFSWTTTEDWIPPFFN